MQRDPVTWVDACIGLAALFNFFFGGGGGTDEPSNRASGFVPERLSMEEKGFRFLRGILAHLNQGGGGGGANQVR